MKEKRIIVLLSTYNGEKYLKTQLDSILKQSYKNYKIFIRDDGSKDKTIEILKKYEKNNKIIVTYGKNIGFYKSFLWLLNNAPKADYYSFCDQDDFWLNTKLERAVNLLNEYDNLKPNLYFSDYNICNEKLEFQSISSKNIDPYSLERALLSVQSPCGFNTVINYTTRKMIKENTNENVKIWGHDYWCYLLCITFGNIIYDQFPTANYRRHENNVSNYTSNFVKKNLLRIKNFLINNARKDINDTVALFYKTFSDKMDDRTKKIYKIYINDKFNLKDNINKTIYKKRYSSSLFDEFVIRLMLLVGRI